MTDLPQADSVPIELATDTLLEPLKSAEETLIQIPSVDLSSSPVNFANTRGICALRGGAGLYLAPVRFSTSSACLTACNSLAAAHPNLICYFKGNILRGDPLQACLIRGGGLQTLRSDAAVTLSECQTSCSGFASHPFRVCDWGTERIRQPPSGSECRIQGGADRLLGTGIVFASRNDCQNLCDSFGTNSLRRCVYGHEVLREPAEEQRCEIWGGAGRLLSQTVFGQRAECQTACDSFAANVNRFCFYGKVRL